MKKIRGKYKAYEERIQSKSHAQRLKLNFPGTWDEVKDIIRIFGEKQADYFSHEDAAKFYPVLSYGFMEAAADFKYCYEQFKKIYTEQFGLESWRDLYMFFEENRVNELYELISPNPNLTYLYNLPIYLILKKDMSASAFRVLCAFMARAKRIKELGGARVCGWSAQGLGKKIGLHRNTVAACIKELEGFGYLSFMPHMSNERFKKYKINVY